MEDLNYLSGPHNLAEAVADVGGTIQKFLNFMQIFRNFGKIVRWRPLLRVILDQPQAKEGASSSGFSSEGNKGTWSPS